MGLRGIESGIEAKTGHEARNGPDMGMQMGIDNVVNSKDK